MPHKCETRAGKARGSRNSFDGWFRGSDTPKAPLSQLVQGLIALHIGASFCAEWPGSAGNG